MAFVFVFSEKKMATSFLDLVTFFENLGARCLLEKKVNFVPWMTGMTGMTRMTGITRMTKMTGMTRMTGLNKMTRLTRITRMTRITAG